MNWCNTALLYSPVEYGLCKSEEDYHKTLKKLGMPISEWSDFVTKDAATNLFMVKGKRHAIVCIGSTKGYTKEQINSLLVHEAVHVWQDICEQIGERFPSDEFEAYGIQMISQNLMIEMRKK